jgi:hypothetical protein
VSEQTDHVPLNGDTHTYGTDEKKSGIKVSYNGITTKGYALEFNPNTQNMKPFKLLEELCILRNDQTLSKDEKNARIKKMLMTEE